MNDFVEKFQNQKLFYVTYLIIAFNEKSQVDIKIFLLLLKSSIII
jgi:hypothetical protein